MGRGSLGCGRNLGEILPTSLLGLPIQLRDLRNNQKSKNNNFIFSYQNHEFYIFGRGFRFPDLWSRFWGGNFTQNPNLRSQILIFELQRRIFSKNENYESKLFSVIFLHIPLYSCFGTIQPLYRGGGQKPIFSLKFWNFHWRGEGTTNL